MYLLKQAYLHIFTHRHPSIVLRRFFFHFGTVYGYRSFTMTSTILPVPKLPPGHCTSKTDGTLGAVVKRALHTLAGGGLDLNGVTLCGYYFVLPLILYNRI